MVGVKNIRGKNRKRWRPGDFSCQSEQDPSRVRDMKDAEGKKIRGHPDNQPAEELPASPAAEQRASPKPVGNYIHAKLPAIATGQSQRPAAINWTCSRTIPLGHNLRKRLRPRKMTNKHPPARVPKENPAPSHQAKSHRPRLPTVSA